MSVFLDSLREAHAVTVSHMMGDATCGAICHRTRLPVPVVREWLRLLNLPVREFNTDARAPGFGFINPAVDQE